MARMYAMIGGAGLLLAGCTSSPEASATETCQGLVRTEHPVPSLLFHADGGGVHQATDGAWMVRGLVDMGPDAGHRATYVYECALRRDAGGRFTGTADLLLP